MKKALEFILIFTMYIIISLITIHLFKLVSDLYWFIGIFAGLLFASIFSLRFFSWKFKICIAFLLSAFTIIITAFLNYNIFDPYSNDHYSTDHRIVFAMIAPKNENGEPNLQLIEQIMFFVIAFLILLIMIWLVKKISLRIASKKNL